MKFLFSSSNRHLTRSLRSLVSYRVKHSKRNSISTRAIYYSLYMVIGPNLFFGFPEQEYTTSWKRRLHVSVETIRVGKYGPGKNQSECPDLPQNYLAIKWINNGLYLARKYARIFVHGRYWFQDANSFPKVKLEENCDLEEQIMFEEKNTSIFFRKIGVVFPILQMYFNTRERETLFTKSLLYEAWDVFFVFSGTNFTNKKYLPSSVRTTKRFLTLN